MKTEAWNKLGLETRRYLRQRTAPGRRDPEYFPLRDLRDAVLRLAEGLEGRTLDYGCGGSPYRESLPPLRPYVRADIAAGEGVDVVFSETGLVPENDASFDVIISTQVLEHVPRPIAYLQECRRLLRPGGRLIVTTHGFFIEHGCPHDYHRWTVVGLVQLVRDAGFEVEQSLKLTGGLRAGLQGVHYLVRDGLRFPGRPWLHYPFAVLRRLYRWTVLPLLNAFGDALGDPGLLPGDHPANLYVGVAVRAHKP